MLHGIAENGEANRRLLAGGDLAPVLQIGKSVNVFEHDLPADIFAGTRGGSQAEFRGICNLRMDDTNPAKEEVEYVESIIADVKWLIGGWAEDRLGMKPRGKTPEIVNVNGVSDFQLSATPKKIREHATNVGFRNSQ